MIEIVKELGELFKLLPETAIWIGAGILIYKIVVIGSIFGVAKLLIIKFHDWGVRPKLITHNVNLETIENDLITCDSTPREFFNFIRGLKGLHPSTRGISGTSKGPKAHTRHGLQYIHSCDLKWVLEAIEMRKQAELKGEI